MTVKAFVQSDTFLGINIAPTKALPKMALLMMTRVSQSLQLIEPTKPTKSIKQMRDWLI